MIAKSIARLQGARRGQPPDEPAAAAGQTNGEVGEGAERGLTPASGESPPVVSVRHLAKEFKRNDGRVVRAVDEVSFDVHRGEFVVLLGPSGCGKTTLLRSVAGLESPDAGSIRLHGEAVFSAEQRIDVPPEKRRISMIFQSYALWPQMTVYQNVAYPLASRRTPRRDIPDRVHQVLELVGIGDLARQHPAEMSGGQQQRVALARALISGDELILFDEPLSNVDAKVREQLRFELLEMQKTVGFSALYVTHDQGEAMGLADRIAVMEEGRVVQLGSPREVYEQPAGRYVANFIGSTNEVPGVVRSGDGTRVETPLGAIDCAPGDRRFEDGDEVVAVFRPERCTLSPAEPAAVNRWKGVVVTASFLGSHAEVVVDVAGHHFLIWDSGPDEVVAGSEIWISVEPSCIRVLPAAGPVRHGGEEPAS